MAGLSLSVGISGGSWAAMRLLWTAIEWKGETLAALTVDIEQARETLTEIEETTWGRSTARIVSQLHASPALAGQTRLPLVHKEPPRSNRSERG